MARSIHMALPQWLGNCCCTQTPTRVYAYVRTCTCAHTHSVRSQRMATMCFLGPRPRTTGPHRAAIRCQLPPAPLQQHPQRCVHAHTPPACVHTHACAHSRTQVRIHTNACIHTHARTHAMLLSRPLRPDLVPGGVELMLRWGWVEGDSSQEGVHESK